jgi:VanZ family protein
MTPAAGKTIRAAALAYVALLAVASLLPSGTGPLKGWDDRLSPDLQDVLHFPAYTGLVVMAVLAWSTRFRTGAAAVVVIAAACAAFGAAMEAGQYFIPGRTCSLSDGLVNTLGAGLGCLGVLARKHRNPAKTPGSIGMHSQERVRCDPR